MTNVFAASALKTATKSSNKTTTTNGAKAFVSTLNANLDFFSKSGNMGYPSLLSDFAKAFDENRDLALRNLLHTRDVRGGKGIRSNTRTILTWLVQTHPSTVLETLLIQRLPEVGRWDDLFTLAVAGNVDITNKVIKYLGQEISKEVPNQLLAKWLPTKSKNPTDKFISSKLRSYLKLTPKEYRQLLVKNRNVVETQMCNKTWTAINYSHVPSKAMSIYHKAFQRNDQTRFSAFTEKAVKGEVKINSSTLWPHEVIGSHAGRLTQTQEAQWNALPNFLPEGISILPVVDVSGSMTCSAYERFSCMDISIALGIYLASKAKSDFKDLFITFDSNPTFVNLSKCKSLQDRVTTTRQAPWGMSTNIEAVFDLIIDHAIKHNVPKEDMPQSILILSDMQFDSCAQNKTVSKTVKNKFVNAGYDVPQLIFWTLSARYANQPVKFDTDKTALVSGYSPASLKAIFNVDLDRFTPENVMIETLNIDRYSI